MKAWETQSIKLNQICLISETLEAIKMALTKLDTQQQHH